MKAVTNSKLNVFDWSTYNCSYWNYHQQYCGTKIRTFCNNYVNDWIIFVTQKIINSLGDRFIFVPQKNLNSLANWIFFCITNKLSFHWIIALLLHHKKLLIHRMIEFFLHHKKIVISLVHCIIFVSRKIHHFNCSLRYLCITKKWSFHWMTDLFLRRKKKKKNLLVRL